MFSNKEFLFFCASIALCAAYFPFKLGYEMDGHSLGGEVVGGYIFLTLFLYVFLFLALLLMILKSRSFINRSIRKNFSGAKWLKASADMLAVVLLLVFVTSLYDFPVVLVEIVRSGDFKKIFSVYGFWQWIMSIGLLIFGVFAFKIYNKAYKLYCFLFPDIPEGVKIDSKLTPYEPPANGNKKAVSDEDNFKEEKPHYIPYNAQTNKTPESSENPDLEELIPLDVNYEKMRFIPPTPSEDENSVPLVECPMCGTMNPAENEKCEFCGAQIKSDAE